MTVMADSALHSPASPRPSLRELFLAFVAIALSGFGGSLPWARRVMVERKQWMSAEEFNEVFAMSQFLPGPNIVNFAIVFGSRFRGPLGAAVALVGLLGPPLTLITGLAVLYEHFGDHAAVSRVLSGVTAAAAGLLIAMTAKMAAPVFTRRWDWQALIVLVAFAAVALIRWPLPYVIAVLAPVSILLAWWRSPRA